MKETVGDTYNLKKSQTLNTHVVERLNCYNFFKQYSVHVQGLSDESTKIMINNMCRTYSADLPTKILTTYTYPSEIRELIYLVSASNTVSTGADEYLLSRGYFTSTGLSLLKDEGCKLLYDICDLMGDSTYD